MKNTSKKYTSDGNLIYLNYGPRMSKSTYKSLQDYRTAYVKEHYRQFNVKLSRTHHDDVIKWMEAHDNLVQYITDLVRKDLLRES